VLVVIVSTVAVFSVDQGSKALWARHAAVTINPSPAFGLIHSRRVLACGWAISFVVALFAGPVHSLLVRAALGAVLGGAAGNLADLRMRHGVVDFIDVGFWPVFNLADVAIVTGAGAVLVGVAMTAGL